MPGAPDNVVIDALSLHHDQELIDRITKDLSHRFQYGWLEHHFNEFFSETVERLVVDHHKELKKIADELAVEVTVYLTDNKLI